MLNDSATQHFLQLAQDPFWCVNSLEALAVLMKEEKKSIEPILIKAENLDLFLTFISNLNSDEKILNPLRRLLHSSINLTTLLNKAEVVRKFLSFLENQSPLVRLLALQMIQSLVATVNNFALFDEIYGLSKKLLSVLQHEKSILVIDLMNQVLKNK